MCGITRDGTACQVFKPGNTFNSLTQLVPNGTYILDADKLGFDLPGAALTASTVTGPAAATLTLTSFQHSFSGGIDNLTLQVASLVATNTEYLLVFDSPGAYSYKLALDDTVSLSVPNAAVEQVVTPTAVAPSGARLSHTFMVGEQAAAPSAL